MQVMMGHATAVTISLLVLLLGFLQPFTQLDAVRTEHVNTGSLPTHNGSSSSVVIPFQITPILVNGHVWAVTNVIEIQMGTPAQRVGVVFDTGSFSPVIYSANCTGYCGNWTNYNSSRSSTSYVFHDENVSVEYGAGTISGVSARDHFSIGSLELSAHQRFDLVMNASWFASNSYVDQLPNNTGIFGVSPKPSFHPDPNVPSTTLALLARGIEMVTVTAPRADPYAMEAGQVQFGGYDKLNPLGEEPAWTPASALAENGWGWFMFLADFKVNGVSSGECNYEAQNCQVTFDTGGGSLEVFTKILHSSTRFPLTFPCTNREV